MRLFGAALVLGTVLMLVLMPQFARAVNGLPTISSISPASGPTSGGTVVTITGTNFLNGPTSVTFGGFPAVSVFNVSDTSLQAIAPSGTGTAVVRVAATGGISTASNTGVNAYTYSNGPVITLVSPSSGPASGGGVISISGTGFVGSTATTSVSFGGSPAAVLSVSPTLVTVTLPAHAVGPVSVTVTDPSGTSAPAAFTYTATGPVVSSLSPTAGSTAGGYLVSIFGSGFTGATMVSFGGTPVFAPLVLNDGQINVTAPAHLAGTVVVTVTTPSGTSSAVPAAGNQFTYGVVGVPVITSVSPASGPTVGGTAVTILGSGFTGVTSVTFGGFPSSFVSFISDGHLVATSPAHFAATVAVQVTTPGGTSTPALSVANAFTYGGVFGFPVITSVSPNFGPTSGGTSVTILGSGFTGAFSVNFGGTPAFFSVLNDGQIVATSPAHFAGTVDVVVTNGVGSSALTVADRFTYGGVISGVPVVTSVSPASGPTSGGTGVTIYGSNFSGATSVTFGGYIAFFTVLSNSQIYATSPAHFAGTVDVVVSNGFGSSAITFADRFTYGGVFGIVYISSISPASGPTTGGTTVTIYGAGFSGGTSVYFGGTPATFSVVSDSQIIATSPPHVAGTVDVVVSSIQGSSSTSAGDQFTYFGGGVATITGVNPSSGAGGTPVTITGSGFTGATLVSFGGVAGTSLVVVSDSTITVVAPSHVSGTVDVVVTGPAGSSLTSGVARFTYVGGTVTYVLSFRWSLIVWNGPDGMSVLTALRGRETPDSADTNDVSGIVTAVLRWNGTQQVWEIYFPGSENVPGANDFTTLRKGQAYWIAINSTTTINWVAPLG